MDNNMSASIKEEPSISAMTVTPEYTPPWEKLIEEVKFKLSKKEKTKLESR